MITTIFVQRINISAVAVAVKFVRLPYTLALVSAGLLLAKIDPLIPSVNLTVPLSPDLLFLGLLPPVLFEGSLGVAWRHLLVDIRPIGWMAITGLFLSTGLLGLMLNRFLGMDLTTSLLFGAMISATDAISGRAYSMMAWLPSFTACW